MEGTPNVPKSGDKWTIFSTYFQRLYISVNNLEKRDINPVARHDSSSAILLVVAHFCSLRKWSDDPRVCRGTRGPPFPFFLPV